MPRHAWGIIGAGSISRQFATDLANVADGRLVAVGSRSPAHVRTYAGEVGADRGHGSYEELAGDDEVELVYVGNNHSEHVEAALLCIEAGKHVLVEKPFSYDRASVARTVAAAADAGVFCMEAMWSAFLPHVATARRLLDEGAVGEVTGGSFRLGRDQRGHYERIFDPARAGGALLDMGIYPIAISRMLLGPADEVTDVEGRVEGGVDREVTVTTVHDGVPVTLATHAERRLDSCAVVEGTAGRLVVPDALHHSPTVELHRDGDVEVVDTSFEGHGFEYEIREVHRCVEQGLLESPGWTHADTLATHEVLDEVRRRLGLVYPFEDGPPGGGPR